MGAGERGGATTQPPARRASEPMPSVRGEEDPPPAPGIRYLGRERHGMELDDLHLMAHLLARIVRWLIDSRKTRRARHRRTR